MYTRSLISIPYCKNRPYRKLTSKDKNKNLAYKPILTIKDKIRGGVWEIT